MTYSNDVIGFDGHYGKREAVPATKIYCDPCAEIALGLNPAYDPNDPYGADRLLRDGYGWQPVFGAPCTRCGEPC